MRLIILGYRLFYLYKHDERRGADGGGDSQIGDKTAI
jgi:hypothetical protein